MFYMTYYGSLRITCKFKSCCHFCYIQSFTNTLVVRRLELYKDVTANCLKLLSDVKNRKYKEQSYLQKVRTFSSNIL